MTDKPTTKPTVVIYGAKSTEDKHGSIPTQLEDSRTLAERNGWEIAGEFADEAFSAFHGNRGPGLARAKALAISLAREHGSAILVAQDADRFARGAGDAPGAADHLAEMFFVLRRQGVALWSVRSGEIDGIRAFIEGERATDESQRKSQSVTAGLARRKASGKPMGAMPLGYAVERQPDDSTRRVQDPAHRPTVEQIFDIVEAGGSYGHVARTLNAQGLRARRGSWFTARGVGVIVMNAAYKGEKGYPAIIDPERYDRIVAGLKRQDPAAVQRRQGGRKTTEPYLLKGIAFCRTCGAPLWTRPQKAGRMYVCSHRRRATGTCQAETIPADLLEGHVLDHIQAFVGDAERWLAERRQDSDQEVRRLQAAVDRHRAESYRWDRQREKLMAEYRQQVAEGASTARLALEAVETVDEELVSTLRLVAQAEAKLEEHDTEADEQHTASLVHTFRDQIAAAENNEALSAALAKGLAGLWASWEAGELIVEFELAAPPIDGVRYLLQNADPVGLEARRVTLPRPEETVFIEHTFPVVNPGGTPWSIRQPAQRSPMLRGGGWWTGTGS